MLAIVLGTVPAAHGATLDQSLRWTPSSSVDVAGYIVHVGDTPGFVNTTGGIAYDMGTNYELANNVASRRLGDILTGSAYVVMQAYDTEGLYSEPSNELYIEIAAATPAPECTVDAECSDGNLCNGAESCISGVCVGGPAPTCGTASACHAAACDPQVGCVEIPTSGGACNDGNACTVGDVCSNGLCVAGSAQTCAAAGPCQVGWCDVASGCQVSPAADGTTCSDGNPETQGDMCRAGSCVGFVPNPEPEPEPGPAPEPEPRDDDGLLQYDGFEFHALNAAPTGWWITDSSGLVLATPKFAVVAASDGGKALASDSEPEWPYYAHVADSGAESWTDYEYIGRMRIEDAGGEIGATIVSGFPGSTDHIALSRHLGSPTFQLRAAPSASCIGRGDTGVAPRVGAWMVFRLRAVQEPDGTRIQAKIWEQEASEPRAWQADCLLPGSALAGRFGVLAGGSGRKLFDDLGAWQVSTSDGSSETTVPIFAADFDAYRKGDRPDGWADSGLVRGRSFFRVARAQQGMALAVGNRSDVYSHVDEPGSVAWQNYEVTGRMMAGYQRTGLGVTIYSRMLEGGSAIALARQGRSGSFRVGLRGVVGSCQGDPDTGFVPTKGEWQQFRLRAITEGASVRVLARVWADGENEPTTWQADCTTAPGLVATSGTIGVWSTGTGAKLWDDFAVREVGGP